MSKMIVFHESGFICGRGQEHGPAYAGNIGPEDARPPVTEAMIFFFADKLCAMAHVGH